MTSKIFRSTLLVAGLVLFAALGLTMGILYRHFTLLRTDQLQHELSLAVTAAEQYGNAFLENVTDESNRLTWIDPQGRVLIDTWVDETTLPSHADREEFQEALQTGHGHAVRNSSTLTEVTIYQAMRLSDGTVLRISGSQRSAGALMLDLVVPMLSAALGALVLCAILSSRVAAWIVGPINRLDLEHPLSQDAYEEITPLLRRINQQNLQIASQLESIRHRADEFEQITLHMKERLVLLNARGEILSLNPMAKQLFSAGEDCTGKHFLSVERSQEMRDALNAALDQGQSITHLNRSGREYQFDLNRIESEGDVIGAVVLAFDITDVMQAEQNRREFSANVSHELKTPLQSILGSAELLQSGMVKAEDTPRFVGHIRRESMRLLQLIEDIIRLSQLDEGVELGMETLDLADIADQVLCQMQDSARQKGVTLSRTGDEACEMSGVGRLLQEIVYNLCDNAIKYNVPGGSVTIDVRKVERSVRLCVKDTGIGIPEEHRSRIFERFYRVDKSHSRASGGTGLGLSIVKHAAACHRAQICLDSCEGKGTSVCVTFPL